MENWFQHLSHFRTAVKVIACWSNFGVAIHTKYFMTKREKERTRRIGSILIRLIALWNEVKCLIYLEMDALGFDIIILYAIVEWCQFVMQESGCFGIDFIAFETYLINNPMRAAVPTISHKIALLRESAQSPRINLMHTVQ